jgi:hypothetical protein
MFTIRESIVSFAAVLALTSCGPATKQQPGTDAQKLLGPPAKLGETACSFESKDGYQVKDRKCSYLKPTDVRAHAALEAKRPLKNVTLAVKNPTALQGDSLLLGLPLAYIGENFVFGGIFHSVSDPDNETYGRMKLVDIAPLHVRALIGKNPAGDYVLALVGCADKCTESSKQEALVVLPVLGVDEHLKTVIVDIAAIGADLDLLAFNETDEDGDGYYDYTELKSISSRAVSVENSLSTVVFDVETLTEPKPAEGEQPDPSKRVTFTARWYLKLASAFSASFVPREPVAETGYFTTTRAEKTRITRWAYDSAEDGPVHYFIKNVPAEHQASFASAFDEWNGSFRKAIGRDLLSYEFVPRGSELDARLVAGDIRYNVVEWDLKNQAPYGGLGPSSGHQFTGELFNANVLVQGPIIVKIYTEWFTVGHHARKLREEGRGREADALVRDHAARLNALLDRHASSRIEVSLGQKLKARVPSQMAAFQDPLADRPDLEKLPLDFDYTSYMKGYWHDLVAHELGHNMGLRHNFRGNLGATDSVSPGSVSRSIMEYLNRNYRHLDHISAYDDMAIAYGYAGKAPEHADWFCTDEDVAGAGNPGSSAECSRDDATKDPFSFYEKRLTKVTDLLVARGEAEAPSWKLADVKNALGVAVNGLALYAFTAEASAAKWTNFYIGGDRPTSPAGVRDYAVAKLREQLCDESFASVVAAKATPEAQAATQANIDELRAAAAKLLAPYAPVIGEAELACLAAPKP